MVAEDLASLDQQQLLPVEAASSDQSTGMQAKPVQFSARNQVIKHTQLMLLQQAIDQMHKLHTVEGVEYAEDSTFQKQLQGIMLDPDQFVASNLRNHLPAWQQYFDHFGHTAQSKQVLVSWSITSCHNLHFEAKRAKKHG